MDHPWSDSHHAKAAGPWNLNQLYSLHNQGTLNEKYFLTSYFPNYKNYDYPPDGGVTVGVAVGVAVGVNVGVTSGVFVGVGGMVAVGVTTPEIK